MILAFVVFADEPKHWGLRRQVPRRPDPQFRKARGDTGANLVHPFRNRSQALSAYGLSVSSSMSPQNAFYNSPLVEPARFTTWYLPSLTPSIKSESLSTIPRLCFAEKVVPKSSQAAKIVLSHSIGLDGRLDHEAYRRMNIKPLAARFLGEAFGTFLLVLFGCGAVHVAVLTDSLPGLWQAAVVWAVGVTLAIYAVGSISGAHINPAITIALAVWNRFPWKYVPAYILGQILGAMLAAATLFLFYGPFLARKENVLGVVRGEPGSEITASCYGEYFPNPGLYDGAKDGYSSDEHRRANQLVSEPVAFFAEVIGTLILTLMVFAVCDERNVKAPPASLAPVFIGLTVAALVVVIAPLTQACLNPARDFGPRLFAAFAGWGRIALPGPRGAGFFTVYILAPIVGATIGGGVYERILRPCMQKTDQ